MKIAKAKILIKLIGLTMTAIIVFSCSKEFLNTVPVGQISDADLNNKAGVNGTLIGAYALLDGTGLGDEAWMTDNQRTSITNAWAGSVAADDAHKGGGNGSQPERGQLQGKSYLATNDILRDRWVFYYAAVQRANDVLRLLPLTPEGEFTEAERTQIIAEARFLRAFYHFELAKMFNNIPYIDETKNAGEANFNVPNSTDPSNPSGWTEMADDLIFAAETLPGTQTQIGRAHKWAAKAMLAKVYMQQANLESAKPILEDIILNGTNSSGVKLDLEPKFRNIWNEEFENGVEAVFTVQMSVKDGGSGENGNDADAFNLPPFANTVAPGTGGWGHQPSFNLANAYKTTGGLPEFDTFNDTNLKNNFEDPSVGFTPDITTPLDPRMDWTIGREGLPFLDWGIMKQERNLDNGPYYTKKSSPYKKEIDDGKSEAVGWKLASGTNFPVIRFSDILLMAAEVEVEIGSLGTALGYVNRVRTRAANPDGMPKTYINNATPATGFTTTNASNYVINTYPSFPDKEYARQAVRFERRLELATEGHRFFDLQRFDRIDKKYAVEPNYMARILNAYMPAEAAIWPATLGAGKVHGYLEGASFTPGKHEIYAIPQGQIDLSKENGANTLTQNPGF